jgi:diphosphoinositol-polyphosphate diphosphatase
MRVTEELPEWEDSRSIGRKRKWFSISEALLQLAQHKPVQRSYIHSLHNTNPYRNNSSMSLVQYPHNPMTSIQLVNNTGSSPHFNKHS